MTSTIHLARPPSQDHAGDRRLPCEGSGHSASTLLYGAFAAGTPHYPGTIPLAPTVDPKLTLHEIRCLAGAARGMTDEQTAEALGLDPQQVSDALETLADVVGVSGRAARPAIVDYGYRTGLLSGLSAEPRNCLGAWLTSRRLTALRLVARGLPDQQIADILGCTRKTATATVRHLVQGFQANDRAHAVALAHQQRVLGQPLMPLPTHRPVRRFSPQEMRIVGALAAGQTKQQMRARWALSARTATRMLSTAAEAAGVPPRRGYAAVVDSAHRGGLLTAEPRSHACTVRLPDREHQILIGIAHGFTDSEIASHLHLPYDTVKTASRQLYSTLGADTRAHAVGRGWHFRLLGTPEATSPTAPRESSGRDVPARARLAAG